MLASSSRLIALTDAPKSRYADDPHSLLLPLRSGAAAHQSIRAALMVLILLNHQASSGFPVTLAACTAATFCVHAAVGCTFFTVRSSSEA